MTATEPLDLSEAHRDLDEIGAGDGAASYALAERLLAEVERLTRERDTLSKVALSNKRHVRFVTEYAERMEPVVEKAVAFHRAEADYRPGAGFQAATRVQASRAEFTAAVATYLATKEG